MKKLIGLFKGKSKDYSYDKIQVYSEKDLKSNKRYEFDPIKKEWRLKNG